MTDLIKHIELLNELCQDSISEPEHLHEHLQFVDQAINNIRACGVSDVFGLEHAIKQSMMHNHRSSLKETKYDKLTEEYADVYLVKAVDSGIYKIGVTTNLEKRIRQLQNFHHEKLILVASAKGGKKTEAKLHKHFSDDVVKGEWFKLTCDQVSKIEAFLGGEAKL
ncbi:GIY-YIG nuclease family protein [Vibrio artabrorum]|uniref:GIY-YIG nuclease family protein n=1 Tax=Vibrio artabrorum TaxID=446374 RepID=UPI003553E54E